MAINMNVMWSFELLKIRNEYLTFTTQIKCFIFSWIMEKESQKFLVSTTFLLECFFMIYIFDKGSESQWRKSSNETFVYLMLILKSRCHIQFVHAFLAQVNFSGHKMCFTKNFGKLITLQGDTLRTKVGEPPKGSR